MPGTAMTDVETKVRALVTTGRITGGMVLDAMSEAGVAGWFPSRCDSPIIGTQPTRAVLGKARTSVVGSWARTSNAAELNKYMTDEQTADFYDSLAPGEVLFIECDGAVFWGELLSEFAARKGVLATVLNGASRDFHRTQGTQYPVWAKGFVSGLSGRTCGLVKTDVPLNCGVVTGQWIFVDADGVLSFDVKRQEEVFMAILRLVDAETKALNRIRDGATARELLAEGVRL
jgi:regulator of RNase E activity RraA